MVFSVQSCALIGLRPHLVVCEVDLACQLPAVSLVGLPSSLTQESRERIRAAVVNSGFEWPARKVTINLLPASLPKWGSHFELAMALGVLAAAERTDSSPCLEVFAVGELSLSGELRSCGWLPLVAEWLLGRAQQLRDSGGEPLLIFAHELDVAHLLECAPDLRGVCELVGVATLAQAQGALQEALARATSAPDRSAARRRMVAAGPERRVPTRTFELLSQVRDEPLGVVAALVALAGRHHCLFAGPHGMGKSMLIRGICQALPELSSPERLERRALFNTFGQGFSPTNDSDEALSSFDERPAVWLQTSISRAGLEGALLSTGQIVPGEMTRAHCGALIVDELLEFRRDVIESFRQPLDDGVIRLQRARFHCELPARFQLLSSTNLCPCGKWGVDGDECVCPRPRREAYQAKLSGPILDRFDLVVLVGRATELNQAVRKAAIPTDLVALVSRLTNPNEWPVLLEQHARNQRASEPRKSDEPAQLWCEVPERVSNRGKLRLAKIAWTLAGLLGERRQARHLRLAFLLRQGLLERISGKISTDHLEKQCKNSFLNYI